MIKCRRRELLLFLCLVQAASSSFLVSPPPGHRQPLPPHQEACSHKNHRNEYYNYYYYYCCNQVGRGHHFQPKPPTARSSSRRTLRPRTDLRLGTINNAPTNNNNNNNNPLAFFLFPKFGKSESDTEDDRRNAWKEALLDACASNPPTVSSSRQAHRNNVENAIEALLTGCGSPIQATASSALLQKKWKLIWTTEKEINFFLDNGWATEITQTIQGNQLQNDIPFVQGGGFRVEGSLHVPNVNGQRTDFSFTRATLDLRPNWGQWNVPPIGKGWFDTVYLDDTLRVDTNSRNDILICEPYPEK